MSLAGGATRVLVVDEEPAIQRALRAGLEARGYAVAIAESAAEAVARIAGEPFDLVLLDLALPDEDGLTVVERVRQWTDLPIIVLTADGHEHRKVVALDDGADDYVTKPFSMPELLARVRVALRHRAARLGGDDEPVLVVGDLTLDVADHRCRLGGCEVDLTPKEFALLALLARWPGRVVTHRLLLHEVWGPGHERETQYLRTYAATIRKKLGEAAEAAGAAGVVVPRLVSEPGVGYRLLAADDALTG